MSKHRAERLMMPTRCYYALNRSDRQESQQTSAREAALTPQKEVQERIIVAACQIKWLNLDDTLAYLNILGPKSEPSSIFRC